MAASPSGGPLFPPSTPQGRVGLPGDLGPLRQCASGSCVLWSVCWNPPCSGAILVALPFCVPLRAIQGLLLASGCGFWAPALPVPTLRTLSHLWGPGTCLPAQALGCTRDSASPMPASCHSPEVQAAAAQAPGRGWHPVHSGWLRTGLSVVSVSMAKKQPGRLCLAEAEALRKQNRPGSRRGGSTSAGKRVKVRSPEQPTASPDARLQACVCTSTSSPPCLLPGGPALGGSGGGCAQGGPQGALSC